jgi:hypothetical protein
LDSGIAYSISLVNMASSTKVFSLEGRGLRLDTAADLEPYITELRAMDDVEEVRLLGNTLGVGACKLLGDVLATKENLQASYKNRIIVCLCYIDPTLRSPTSLISSPVVYSAKSLKRSRSCLPQF